MAGVVKNLSFLQNDLKNDVHITLHLQFLPHLHHGKNLIAICKCTKIMLQNYFRFSGGACSTGGGHLVVYGRCYFCVINTGGFQSCYIGFSGIAVPKPEACLLPPPFGLLCKNNFLALLRLWSLSQPYISHFKASIFVVLLVAC